MATETNTSSDAANADVNAPAKPVVPAAAPAVQTQNEDPNNPPWLPERLARERKAAAKEAEANARKSMLAELGIDDPESVKRLLAEEKKRAEAQKSLETKVAERDAALSAKDTRNKELEESVKSYAEAQLSGLTEQQKNAVIAVAGTDPPKQLKAIEALRPTWGTTPAIAAPPVTTTTQVDTTTIAGSSNANQAPPAGKPAAATAPGATAPPANGGAPLIANHLEVYESLSNPASSNFKPFAAGAYLLAHGKEIEAARKARGLN